MLAAPRTPAALVTDFVAPFLNVAAMTASASLCAQLNHFSVRLVLNLMREKLTIVAEPEKSGERGNECQA